MRFLASLFVVDLISNEANPKLTLPAVTAVMHMAGFRVYGLWFRVQGKEPPGSRIRACYGVNRVFVIRALGFRVWDLWFEGSGA